MLAGHGVSVGEASEALADPNCVVISPDYNSRSGRTLRVIGYSESAAALLSIILIDYEATTYGVNGWRSNIKDRTIYMEG